LVAQPLAKPSTFDSAIAQIHRCVPVACENIRVTVPAWFTGCKPNALWLESERKNQ
jgi:hypothetical protein